MQNSVSQNSRYSLESLEKLCPCETDWKSGSGSDQLICKPVLASSCFLLKEQTKTFLNNPHEL